MKSINRLALVGGVVPLMVPALLMASGGGHEAGGHGGAPNPQWLYLVFHAINLSALIYIIQRATRRFLRDYLIKRQDTIRDALEQAERARKVAEEKKAEYEARLAGLEAEVATFRAEMEQKAREEAAAMVAGAKVAAERIAKDTERLLADELSRAQYQVSREAVELAVELARDLLVRQLGQADQSRLAENYLKRLEQPMEIN